VYYRVPGKEEPLENTQEDDDVKDADVDICSHSLYPFDSPGPVGFVIVYHYYADSRNLAKLCAIMMHLPNIQTVNHLTMFLMGRSEASKPGIAFINLRKQIYELPRTGNSHFGFLFFYEFEFLYVMIFNIFTILVFRTRHSCA